MKKFAIASAVLVSLVTGGSAMADTCKDVDIKVNNKRSNKIKVLKFSYRCDTDNTDRTESVTNREVNANSDTKYENQNLAGCKGYEMKYLTVHYNAYCGGKWSSIEYQVKKTEFNVPKCENDGDYFIDVLASSPGCSN